MSHDADRRTTIRDGLTGIDAKLAETSGLIDQCGPLHPGDYRNGMVLLALVLALESALRCAHLKLAQDTEPFPGATETVVSQALDTIAITRKAGIIPDRSKKP